MGPIDDKVVGELGALYNQNVDNAMMQENAQRVYKETRQAAEAAAKEAAAHNWSPLRITVPETFWDKVERPAHYCAHKHTTAEIVTDWELDFFLGNVLKYIERHKLKGDPEGDLRKAKKYLEMKIELLEKGRLEDSITHG